MGTLSNSAKILNSLIVAGAPISIVVTKGPKRRSRGSKVDVTPVEMVAKEFGVECTYNLEDVEGKADFGVVVAFGKIIPNSLLSRIPMVNIHYSLLPRWRGATPVESAILAGDYLTGVSLMEVVDELDAGDTFEIKSTTIKPNESASELFERLTKIGEDMLLTRLVPTQNHLATFTNRSLGRLSPQSGDITWARKIPPSLKRLDFHQNTSSVSRIIRIGGAYSYFGDLRIRIDKAEQIEDIEEIVEIGEVAETLEVSKSGHSERATLISEGEKTIFKRYIAGLNLRPGECVARGNEIFLMCGGGVLKLLQVTQSGKATMSAPSWYNGAKGRLGDNETLLLN